MTINAFQFLNSTTTTFEFWKSNPKILAASYSLYNKLTGSSASVNRAKSEIDLTVSDEDVDSPPTKCHKLDQILH